MAGAWCAPAPQVTIAYLFDQVSEPSIRNSLEEPLLVALDDVLSRLTVARVVQGKRVTEG
jgi:hypothetical protein